MAATGIRIRLRRARDNYILYDSGGLVAEATEVIMDLDMSPAGVNPYYEIYYIEAMTVDIGSQANKPAQANCGFASTLGLGLQR